MKKLFSKCWFVPSVTAAALALLIYGAYSAYYEFCVTAEGVSGIAYTVLASIACAWIFFVFIDSIFVYSSNIIKGIIATVLGAGFFQATLWVTNSVINTDFLAEERVIFITLMITFALISVLLLAAFILRTRTEKTSINVITGIVLFCVSLGALYTSSAEEINRFIVQQEIKFDTVDASQMAVSDAEKLRCREWYNTNILLKNGTTTLPYTFDVGGKSINDDIDNWTIDVSEESETGKVYRGGKTSYITLTHKTNGLKATVEATIYEENATCEWTVFIKNEAEENSKTIDNFYAFDNSIDTGKSELYYSKGSYDRADDFSLLKKELSSFNSSFGSDEGRSTDSYLTYFNIYGENYGAILSIGWTGRWEAKLRQNDNNVDIRVGQEKFDAYLLPAEEVRSPLVSLTFYETKNPLKGFNMFRNWVLDCVYPENIQNTYTMLEIAGPESLETTQQILQTLKNTNDSVFRGTDNFWMDAGWYPKTDKNWYDGVGNWTPDPTRYPDGISQLSEYAESKNNGLVLWYEAERVTNGTPLYTKGAENEEWLVTFEDGKYAMWNLANEDAMNYLSEHISASLIENGVSVYRQDFNFAPDKLWDKADKEFYDGRKGICENHYVTNLYKYLDNLCANVDGLVIDNCASGGRRLDLEMTRRSIPIWRSDYNCMVRTDIYEATQSQTYGLSMWLPLSGTIKYAGNEYQSRSTILTCQLDTFGTISSADRGNYTEQRKLMTENYYPLESGSYSNSKILAMQYSKENGTKGTAFIYKRANVEDTEYTLKLNGLNSASTYKVYDYDTPGNVFYYKGADLMNEGITVKLPEGEKAIIYMFSAVA